MLYGSVQLLDALPRLAIPSFYYVYYFPNHSSCCCCYSFRLWCHSYSSTSMLTTRWTLYCSSSLSPKDIFSGFAKANIPTHAFIYTSKFSHFQIFWILRSIFLIASFLPFTLSPFEQLTHCYYNGLPIYLLISSTKLAGGSTGKWQSPNCLFSLGTSKMHGH